MVAPALAVELAGVVLSVLVLWYGSRLLVDAAVRLSRRLGISELTIGLTVVAMGTSAPELVVSSDAALAGLGDIAVGNVVGSSIYNLAVILGIVALFQGVPVDRTVVRREGLVLLASTAGGVVFVRDLVIDRFEGLFLLTGFLAYLAVLFRSGASSEESADSSLERDQDRASPWLDPAWIVVGLALVVGGGHFLVGSAANLARLLGVPPWAIGSTIVAAGTSTPELAVSIVAIGRGRLGVSVGNVVGSNVFNMLGILGVVALLRPLRFDAAAIGDAIWLLVLSALVSLALWTGRTLSRREGGAMVLSELARWVSEFVR